MCISLHCECYGNNFCHWNLSHGTHSSISAIITFFFWIHLVTNFGSILCFALSTGAIIFTIMNIIGLIMGCKWGVDPPVKAPPDALTSRALFPSPSSLSRIQFQMHCNEVLFTFGHRALRTEISRILEQETFESDRSFHSTFFAGQHWTPPL